MKQPTWLATMPRWQRWIATWAPRLCPLCGEVSLEEAYAEVAVCRGCMSALEPRHDEVGELRREAPLPVVAGFRYGGAIADWIVDAKFGGQAPSLDLLCRPWLVLASEVAEELGIDAWVAVPPQRQRLRRRGWHLPDLLAARLARASGRPALQALVRTDLHGPRAAGTREGAAFSATGSAGPLVVGLVDDVVTTGCTAEAAIATLATAGIRCVALAVLADARHDAHLLASAPSRRR